PVSKIGPSYFSGRNGRRGGFSNAEKDPMNSKELNEESYEVNREDFVRRCLENESIIQDILSL
ncbi:hypothetical protein HAX54_028629, partial [Datura stramonium]|nr:hypothetical protein [Datura stramonium]